MDFFYKYVCREKNRTDNTIEKDIKFDKKSYFFIVKKGRICYTINTIKINKIMETEEEKRIWRRMQRLLYQSLRGV